MRIFITGASGFVGSHLQQHLLQAGYELCCLQHDQPLKEDPRVKTVAVDLFDPGAMAEAMRGADACIHLVGIIRQFPARGVTFERLHLQATAAVLEACKVSGVKRYLHMSANGSRAEATTQYHRSKFAAEELVRETSLDWTIFRPSLIYGPGDQFINMLSRQIALLPLIPVIGDGNYRLQPIDVGTLVAGFGAALSQPKAISTIYHCSGRQELSYNQLLLEIAATMGRPKPHLFHQPLLLMKPLVALAESLPFFPLTSDQLQMLLEGNCADPELWLSELELHPPDLKQGLSWLAK